MPIRDKISHLPSGNWVYKYNKTLKKNKGYLLYRKLIHIIWCIIFTLWYSFYDFFLSWVFHWLEDWSVNAWHPALCRSLEFIGWADSKELVYRAFGRLINSLDSKFYLFLIIFTLFGTRVYLWYLEEGRQSLGEGNKVTFMPPTYQQV